ncbi:MAG: Nif3-like dinuclear metal center hexameric protein [Clostridiales Family XIII bacterium]|nr:Nif3-like dinuclear metal center hexameric protein [Clostridiales Family XIII bacterium]
MAIDTARLIQNIEKIAPASLAEGWDNTGMQIDMGAAAVKRALISLEITGEAISEAERLNADFIICHHPLIFDKINIIDGNDVTGNQIIRLIRAGVSVYAAHTSFDSAYGGNNDRLAELLGLQKLRRVQPRKETPDKAILGRIGDLREEKSLDEVCGLLKARLGIERPLPVVGRPERRIRKVGICTGGAGDLIRDFARNGCSLFITADLRHHEALFALENGICLIDAGHYASESIFVANFAEKLRDAVGDVLEVIESRSGREPFRYV